MFPVLFQLLFPGLISGYPSAVRLLKCWHPPPLPRTGVLGLYFYQNFSLYEHTEDHASDCHTYVDVPNVYLLFLTVPIVSNLTVYLAICTFKSNSTSNVKTGIFSFPLWFPILCIGLILAQLLKHHDDYSFHIRHQTMRSYCFTTGTFPETFHFSPPQSWWPLAYGVKFLKGLSPSILGFLTCSFYSKTRVPLRKHTFCRVTALLKPSGFPKVSLGPTWHYCSHHDLYFQPAKLYFPLSLSFSLPGLSVLLSVSHFLLRITLLFPPWKAPLLQIFIPCPSLSCRPLSKCLLLRKHLYNHSLGMVEL